MRVVVQRVARAKVWVRGTVVGEIEKGLLLLVAARRGDNGEDVQWMADKITGLRVFPDEQEKMNLNVMQVAGEILAVSQFTLYGDCRKGKRPSFAEASPPQEAGKLYQAFVEALRDRGAPTQEGVFGAMMQVELLNDGPVTLIVESPPRE